MLGKYRNHREIALSVLIVILFGVGLYFLNVQIGRLPQLHEARWILWTFRILLGLYACLVLVTLHHILTTYNLERFDPGSRASMKRLLRRFRYRLPTKINVTDASLKRFEQKLMQNGFHLEFADSISGKVYYRSRSRGLWGKPQIERIMIKRHDALNVILVDQILQDCIRFLQSLQKRPSQKNVILIVSETQDSYDMASAAAGVVNFLGRYEKGSLGPMLMSGRHGRLFYAADRTILPRSHRLYQNKVRRELLSALRKSTASAAHVPPNVPNR